MSKTKRILFYGVLTFILQSCATQPIGGINTSEDLTKELPSDLQQKFSLKDVEPEDVLENEPTSRNKSEKKSKKVKIQKQAFVYPNRRPNRPDPVWKGEKLVYELTYFGVAAGDFTLETLPLKEMNGRTVYHFFGRAVTAKFFEMFYKVDDTVESFFDYEGLFSHRFHLKLNESKQTRDALELYDSEKRQTFYWNRWNHWKKGYIESKDYKDMEPFPQDSISAIYYLRFLPFEIGKSQKFNVVTEGKTWEAEAHYLRNEVIDTPFGETKTIVLRPQTRFEGVLKETGKSLFWVTDDDRRILVRIEAKVKIGSVVARLKEAHLGTPP